MMPRRTHPIHVSVPLSANTMAEAMGSFANGLEQLQSEGTRQGREVLFDTLVVAIERYSTDTRMLTEVSSTQLTTHVCIEMTAEGVTR